MVIVFRTRGTCLVAPIALHVEKGRPGAANQLDQGGRSGVCRSVRVCIQQDTNRAFDPF